MTDQEIIEMMTPEDREAYYAHLADAAYADRIQYVFKIKLNSLYGALTNLYFRFYDLRMGESTTATGRAILRHQCRKVNEVLEGKYDIDLPLYRTVEDAIESGKTENDALYGPKFNGKFQTNTIIYGDTDSTYFNTHCDNVEDATKVADYVANCVNESYPEFMRERFLCQPEFDLLIKAGREIISDRGIFVEKKRYILHLVDLDGRKVDKIKVMGLDTKKTTLPSDVSDKLNGFIADFLKGATWEKVSKEIVDYKDELARSEDIMAIGLPKGVKGVETYTTDYEMYGDKARLPGHVAASIFYNKCREKYKDKSSIPITSGMKIKVFYLIGKHGKFKSIAIPTDTEVVPKWFLDDFDVDIDAHIERLVDNPLENILKAIGKKPPTRKSMLIESAVEF